ncbi:MAG: phage tail protein [Fusobacterium necrophorum]|nr:phage tail protein [Fusobacterium necrophorum]
MYVVTLINNDKRVTINNLGTSINCRVDGEIRLGINTINEFTFTILPNNNGFNLIKPLKTLVEVLNTKTNVVEFRGRVLLETPSMCSDGVISKKVTCESELGYLMDSVQEYGEYHNISVREFLNFILETHNKQVDNEKNFKLGDVTVTDPNDSLYRYLNYEKTFDIIKDKLINRLGGELQVRYENGIRYLDYLTVIGEKKDTSIILAKNLISIEQEKDATEIITRLFPLGEKLEGTDERLTIESVNGGKKYIDDEEAINEFGIIAGTVIFDDVTIPANLLRKGKDFQKENNRIKKKHNVSALDLSIIGLDYNNFTIANTYHVTNSLMNLDEDLRIVEKNIKINTPEESSMVMGDKFETLNEYQINTLKSMNKVDNINDDLSFTKLEVKNVSNLANTAVENVNKISKEVVDLGSNTNETIANVVDSVILLSEVVTSLTNELENLNEIILEMNKTIKENSERITLLERGDKDGE